MSVQNQCPSRLPGRVRIEVFGQEVVGRVQDTTLEATAGSGPGDVLTVIVDGSQYRVPATEAEPVYG